MLIEQIHYPQSGPNWGKIALITAGVIIVGFMAYNAFKPIKVKIELEPKPDDKTE